MLPLLPLGRAVARVLRRLLRPALTVLFAAFLRRGQDVYSGGGPGVELAPHLEADVLLERDGPRGQGSDGGAGTAARTFAGIRSLLRKVPWVLPKSYRYTPGTRSERVAACPRPGSLRTLLAVLQDNMEARARRVGDFYVANVAVSACATPGAGESPPGARICFARGGRLTKHVMVPPRHINRLQLRARPIHLCTAARVSAGGAEGARADAEAPAPSRYSSGGELAQLGGV